MPNGEARIEAELENRLRLLLMHGLLVFLGGALMLAFGAAQTYEAMFGPWARMALGCGGVLSGGLLMYGTGTSRGAVKLGILGVFLWYAALAIGFTAVVLAHPPALSVPWKPTPPGPVSRPYVIPLYMMLALMAIRHLRTLRKIFRAPR